MTNRWTDRLRTNYPLWILLSMGMLSVFSWLGSVYGLPVRNVLSLDGMRWSVIHVTDNFHASYADWVILFLLAVGMCRESGIWICVRTLLHFTSHGLSLRQERAFQFTFLACFVLFALILSLILVPESPLLSVFGSFSGSPLQRNLPTLIVVTLYTFSLIYGLLAGRFQSMSDVVSASSRLLACESSYFVGLLLAAQFLGLLRYVLPMLDASPRLLTVIAALLYGGPLCLSLMRSAPHNVDHK